MTLTNKEILVIDDDPDLLKIVEKILENSGMRVSKAQSVKEGLQLAEERAPHAIITDLVMPEEDGFSFLEKRRAIPKLRSVPCLVLSAMKGYASVNRAISLGATDYMLKPLAANLLLQKLRKSLFNKAFRRILFEPKERPKITVSVNATITMANETGFLVQAPLKIGKDTHVQLESQILGEMEIKSHKFRTAGRPARFGEGGQYLNDVLIVGLAESSAQKIRKVIRGWN